MLFIKMILINTNRDKLMRYKHNVFLKIWLWPYTVCRFLSLPRSGSVCVWVWINRLLLQILCINMFGFPHPISLKCKTSARKRKHSTKTVTPIAFQLSGTVLCEHLTFSVHSIERAVWRVIFRFFPSSTSNFFSCSKWNSNVCAAIFCSTSALLLLLF